MKIAPQTNEISKQSQSIWLGVLIVIHNLFGSNAFNLNKIYSPIGSQAYLTKL